MTAPNLPPLDATVLPAGIRSRSVESANGLRMHLLEAGHEDPGRPCLLLLHGFPELAYSWRKVMPAFAKAGYHVVAPDLRGYGRTAAGPVAYEADLAPFRMHNLLLDLLCLIAALGRERVVAVIGHDFGSWVAGYCALARPDVFESVVLMSAPFAGAPTLDTLAESLRPPAQDPIHAALAGLPRPREHYHHYFASPAAAPDMDGSPTQVAAFLRAYFHHKSADWPGNAPYSLAGWTAEVLAEIPTYYIMDFGRSMPATVAPEVPEDGGAGCAWLTDRELAVYATEYARTGFQGPLQGYRCRMDGSLARDLGRFAGRHIDVPALFVAGRSDWGPFQAPGALERMGAWAGTQFHGCHFVEDAGHWVQQEQSQAVTDLILAFLRHSAADTGHLT
ncbi:alpha/beta fold hydrolase [Methylobacterium sp. E-065]|uniref:alpha/beta hydrolase n=1 Tax=Methylobacterium sp. E-065 TaxID=2836583 RepID=UPI001FBA76A0|nr:alpha/beta hydrolase [Methylobacterium sp. E-065]MCJ2019375.1 alpha/beta fold hydrolase [Methylobacterium sp. E-065]